MAVTLKKKTITILVIVFFVLSLGATAYILWKVETEEDVTPEEGEAGGLVVGQYGCEFDSDCASAPNGSTECDEVMGNDPSKQRCEYYSCNTGYTLSSDRLECIPDEEEKDLECGEYNCSTDADCTDENNECDERTDHDESRQRCILISCPSGYEMNADKCSCSLIEDDPECGDGELNVTGEECELGDPTGVSCYWTQCNKTTCKCPTCGDGLLNVTGEECESGDPSGVSCTWSECTQSSCTCPEEEEVVVEEDSELPETGISDISDEIMAFYIAFFASGGLLVISFVLESPKKKYENVVVDKIDG